MASNSPSNRLKAVISNSTCTIQSPENQSSSMDGSDSLCCGICLSDNGKAIRGQIDSCEHYFCFVCIMEWAKVESRCPMCKRRFTAICRPPKDGVFSSERVVNVPKRDQVYHLFGNATVGHFDPYARVQCNVCHSSTDECLLLLCDRCDSAAHTYCIGLGATVPEGDWFCHDCAISRSEHGNLQKDSGDINQNLYVKSEVIFATEPSVRTLDVVNDLSTSENSNATDVSVFDIVQESDNQLSNQQLMRFFQVPFPCERRPSLADEMTLQGETTSQTRSDERMPKSDSDKTTETGARTLSRCRNVHNYIRILRENWSSLRSGCLKFSSSSSESSRKSTGKCFSHAVSNDNLGLPHSLTSTSGQQLPTKDTSDVFTQNRPSHDVNKAWKMMDKAKSIQEACRRTKSVDFVSKNPHGKGKRKAIDGSSNLHLSGSQQYSFDSRIQQLGTARLENTMTEKCRKLYSLEKHNEKHISPKLESQKDFLVGTLGIAKCGDRLPTTFPGFSVSSRKVPTGDKGSMCRENWEDLLQKNQFRAPLNLTDQQNGSSHMTTLIGSVPKSSKSLKTRTDLSASSSSKISIPGGYVWLGKGVMGNKMRKDDAKSEIQSLVKLNLKLLNRDKKLEINAFKEVARLATHTILAACGFGQSRHVFHSYPSSVCRHTGGNQQLRKSTLMPNSCRECFYVFVKDVVNSILCEKVSHAKS